jgi:membrane protease YdiL (CAAX protease family)
LVTAFLFGMAHFSGGVPSGFQGLLVAGGLGWLWGVMMLETGGVFLPWLSHFLTNVPTFLYWAVGAASRLGPPLGA